MEPEKLMQDLFRVVGKAVIGAEASNRNLSGIRGLFVRSFHLKDQPTRVKNILHLGPIRINLMYKSAHPPLHS
jgi:hypothetical protein